MTEAKSEAKATPKRVESDESEQGFRGEQADATPNENYTVAGVLAGKPTPETDTK